MSPKDLIFCGFLILVSVLVLFFTGISRDALIFLLGAISQAGITIPIVLILLKLQRVNINQTIVPPTTSLTKSENSTPNKDITQKFKMMGGGDN